MTDKPLHVRVAEALGWTEIARWKFGPDDEIYRVESGGALAGTPPGPTEHLEENGWHLDAIGTVSERDGGDADKTYFSIPRYDTDWYATGPLVEAWQIKLVPYVDGRWEACSHQERWLVDDGYPCAMEPTALLAVCSLILSWQRHGKSLHL